MATVAIMTVRQIQHELGLLEVEIPYMMQVVSGSTCPTERLREHIAVALAEKQAFQRKLDTALQRFMDGLPGTEVEIEPEDDKEEETYPAEEEEPEPTA